MCNRNASIAFCLLLACSTGYAGSADNYLSKAYDRFMSEMLGYPKKPDGSVDWPARSKLFATGAMTIQRPGTGAPGYRSCVYTDYDATSYLLNVYLGLSADEVKRYKTIVYSLFDAPVRGYWGSQYVPNRQALLSALMLTDPGVPPAYGPGELANNTEVQMRLSALYNAAPVGPKYETAGSGQSIDQFAAFNRFVAWNETQAQDLGRYSFWQSMTLWAIAYGVKDMIGTMVPDDSNNGAPSLPSNPVLQLKSNYYFERPQFSLGADGYPIPNKKFKIDRLSEINSLLDYYSSLPDRDSPYAGSVFFEPATRAEKLQKFLIFANAPGYLYGKFYAWARTQQQKAFFDWVIFRYDPHDYGCDDTKEMCWSGMELFSFPGQKIPASCTNDIMQGKAAYANNPAAYTFSYVVSPDTKSRASNLNVITNCYCSDAQ